MSKIEEKNRKKIEKLLNCFKKMNFVEILGFGKLLNVEEKDSIEDFLTEICYSFLEKPRAERRRIEKLAKDVICGR